jgi:hypothetical protein
MVLNDHLSFWLKERVGPPIPPGQEGIRLYWAPQDINATRHRLAELGYAVSSRTSLIAITVRPSSS